MCKHYTIEEIGELVMLARGMKLSGVEILDGLSIDEIRDKANGIGADWMPDALRELVDTLNPSLEPVALVHDLEFDKGGDRLAFLSSNRRFYDNGLKSAKWHYGWYNPARYYVMYQAWKFWKLLDRLGHLAWKGAANPVIDESGVDQPDVT